VFHLGALWRLYEGGLLQSVKRISSVSGGSICAGLLALRWSRLAFSQGIATNFADEVVAPLRDFCSRNIDVGAVITGALNPFKTAGDELADEYRKRLGMGVSLQALPDTPRFVFNSTNYATGVSFRFSKPYAGDWRIGLIRDPAFDLATAVSASSAFPPVLAPVTLDVRPEQFEKVEGADLWDAVDFRRRLLLADGGVYDNLGLETVWGRYDTVLVSDGGKPFELDASAGALAPKQLLRVMDIGLNQALALRKRMLVDAYRQERLKGAFWAIDTPIARYAAAVLPAAPARVQQWSQMRTRLDSFGVREQAELINWGYTVSDAALRTHAAALVAQVQKTQLPYPEHPLE